MIPILLTDGSPLCSGEHFLCSNGTCIWKGLVCDGENDCTDGGDELNCGTSKEFFLKFCAYCSVTRRVH